VLAHLADPAIPATPTALNVAGDKHALGQKMLRKCQMLWLMLAELVLCVRMKEGSLDSQQHTRWQQQECELFPNQSVTLHSSKSSL